MANAQQDVKSASNIVFTLRETGASQASAETNLANRAAVTAGTKPTTIAVATVSETVAYKTLASGASEECTVKARPNAGGRLRTFRFTNLPLTYAAPDGTVTGVPGSALETYLTGKGMTFVSGKFAK